MADSPEILRPTPYHPFDYNSVPNQPPSPSLYADRHYDLDDFELDFDELPSRTHSVLDLTASTLVGVYDESDYYQTDRDGEPIPTWGLSTETPLPPVSTLRRRSTAPSEPPSSRSTSLTLACRTALLFGMGMGYGVLVRHLHNERQLAPFPVEGIIKPSNNWRYLVFWGVAGVALGSLLPWVDTLFAPSSEEAESFSFDTKIGSISPGGSPQQEEMDTSGLFGADWTPVIRSVGAFIGIAFAIRKLPWSSTMQASLTLALVNPVLWYLIDRSKPGFLLSTAVGATGTALLLASNPDMMPTPASSSYRPNATLSQNDFPDHLLRNTAQGSGNGALFGGYVSRETVEGTIWILSVLFCSCVCFGNIGRRLAISHRLGGKKEVFRQERVEPMEDWRGQAMQEEEWGADHKENPLGDWRALERALERELETGRKW